MDVLAFHPFFICFLIWFRNLGAEKGKLADPFYRLEHQEVDLQKKKAAEPLLVRLQRVSDARHADDYSLNKALRAQIRVSYSFAIIFCMQSRMLLIHPF